jgi:hypothetical protein
MHEEPTTVLILVAIQGLTNAEAAAPPLQGRPEVPERLAAAEEWMVARDRAGRFASLAGVIAVLQPFAAGAASARLSLAIRPSAMVAA